VHHKSKVTEGIHFPADGGTLELVTGRTKMLVGITVAIAETGKRRDSDPGRGPPTPGGYNTAATHHRVRRHLLVNSKAPARKPQTPSSPGPREYVTERHHAKLLTDT